MHPPHRQPPVPPDATTPRARTRFKIGVVLLLVGIGVVWWVHHWLFTRLLTPRFL